MEHCRYLMKKKNKTKHKNNLQDWKSAGCLVHAPGPHEQVPGLAIPWLFPLCGLGRSSHLRFYMNWDWKKRLCFPREGVLPQGAVCIWAGRLAHSRLVENEQTPGNTPRQGRI